MKRLSWLLIVVVFSVSFSYAASICFAQKPSGPQIVFRENSFDFGEVDEGAVLEHTYKVWNRGEQPLVIEKVSPS